MSEETIRVIAYNTVNLPAPNHPSAQSKSIDAVASSLRFPSQQPETDTPEPPTAAAISEIDVPVDSLEAQMGRLIDIVERLFARTERQTPTPEIKLDEIELSVEVNGQGQVSLLGTGALAGGKGAIKLKFKRQGLKGDGEE